MFSRLPKDRTLERKDRWKIQPTRPTPAASTAVPCPTIRKSSRTPKHWKLPSTIAEPNHPGVTKVISYSDILVHSIQNKNRHRQVCLIVPSPITEVLFQCRVTSSGNSTNVPSNWQKVFLMGTDFKTGQCFYQWSDLIPIKTSEFLLTPYFYKIYRCLLFSLFFLKALSWLPQVQFRLTYK